MGNMERCALQVQTMQDCVAKVRLWMMVNKLKLNDSKTEVMVITSKNKKNLVKDIRLNSGNLDESNAGTRNTPKPVVKNLGATLDSTLSMRNQVNAAIRSMYYNIRISGSPRLNIT